MALTDVPTTQDEESVSDVIMLEAIPETADVVAPPDARHQPQFTARWWRLAMPGPPTSEEGN